MFLHKRDYITEFGYSERYRSRKVGPDTRDLYLLHFEVKGHCEFCDFDIHEGGACLLSANLVHAFRIVDESTSYWFCFGGERAGEILSAFGIPTDRHARLVINRPRELFSELARFFELAREFSETVEGEKYALSALMSALPRLSVAEVAAATGFSSATRFSQAFSGVCGISPSGFQKQVRGKK